MSNIHKLKNQLPVQMPSTPYHHFMSGDSGPAEIKNRTAGGMV
jgi:hypothetical protein